jgi:arsenate reductase-like glutaredoxin family protein
MASRVTIYGNPGSPDIKRLKREMNVMFVEYEFADPEKDKKAQARLAEWGEIKSWPVVEIVRNDSDGSVFLTNPSEPDLRTSLYSEGILSVNSYWI